MARPALVIFDVNETLPTWGRFAPASSRSARRGGFWRCGLRARFATASRPPQPAPTPVSAQWQGRCCADSSRRSRRCDDRLKTLWSTCSMAFAELDVHPDVAEGMHRFAQAEARMVTLSNGAAEVAEKLLERAGLADLVERCLSLDEVRRWKPAPALPACRQRVRRRARPVRARRGASLGHRRRQARRAASRLAEPAGQSLPGVLPAAGRDRRHARNPRRRAHLAHVRPTGQPSRWSRSQHSSSSRSCVRPRWILLFAAASEISSA